MQWILIRYSRTCSKRGPAYVGSDDTVGITQPAPHRDLRQLRESAEPPITTLLRRRRLRCLCCRRIQHLSQATHTHKLIIINYKVNLIAISDVLSLVLIENDYYLSFIHQINCLLVICYFNYSNEMIWIWWLISLLLTVTIILKLNESVKAA